MENKLAAFDAPSRGTQLTRNNTSPFAIVFIHKLPKGYCFKNLSIANIKKFQSFLDKSCGLTFTEVDKLYKRPTDEKDKYCGEQVIHYEVSDKFRIHGIINKGYFQVTKIDPNHKVHK